LICRPDPGEERQEQQKESSGSQKESALVINKHPKRPAVKALDLIVKWVEAANADGTKKAVDNALLVEAFGRAADPLQQCSIEYHARAHLRWEKSYGASLRIMTFFG
jgi:hypothetical protein